jgi:hypothetical protein
MPQGSHPPEARLDRYSKIGATEPAFVGFGHRGTDRRGEQLRHCSASVRPCQPRGRSRHSRQSRHRRPCPPDRKRSAPPGSTAARRTSSSWSRTRPLSVRTTPFSRSAPVGRDPQSARSSSKIISGYPARSISDPVSAGRTPTGSSLAMRESPCSRFAPPRPLNWSPGRAGRSCRRRARRRSRPRRAR